MNTQADRLIDAATYLRSLRGVVESNASVNVDLVATALKLDKMPPAFKLRAILEGWSMERIVREMW